MRQYFPFTNAYFFEKFYNLCVQSEVSRHVMVSRTRAGFTLNIIDTPGLVEGGYVNEWALDMIKRLVTIFPIILKSSFDFYMIGHKMMHVNSYFKFLLSFPATIVPSLSVFIITWLLILLFLFVSTILSIGKLIATRHLYLSDRVNFKDQDYGLESIHLHCPLLMIKFLSMKLCISFFLFFYYAYFELT